MIEIVKGMFHSDGKPRLLNPLGNAHAASCNWLQQTWMRSHS